jgi:putative alpha-1,2-mannosidase
MTLHFENGKKMIIEAPGNNKDNIYVHEVRLNGRRYGKNYLLHSDLIKGGKLIFKMGADPDNERGTKEEAYPYSMSAEK